MWRTVSLLFVVACIIAAPMLAIAVDGVFLRSLKFGMSGEDVRALQKILNSSPDTQIQSVGVGSPGNETLYFGPLTQKAVIKFQEKYRTIILTPNGLAVGSGYVGPSTLAVLGSFGTKSAIGSTVSAPPPVTNGVSIGEASSPPAPSAETPIETPGFSPTANAEIFLATTKALGEKQGYPADKLARILTQIKRDAATTTDLRAQFIQLAEKNAPKSQPSKSLIEKFVSDVYALFVPHFAHAAVGIPFGGGVLSYFYCLCTNTWQITITPLPPTGAESLAYLDKSQAYLTFNIPFTLWLLGEYEPTPTCYIYTGDSCELVPSRGSILPIVGSSPI